MFQITSQVNKTKEPNKNPVLVIIDFAIKNPNIGRIHVQDITFNGSQKENEIFNDHIGSTSTSSCSGSNYIGCVSYPIEGLTTYHIIRETEVQPRKIDLHDSKYLINASLDYKYDDSGAILSKSFSINYP